MKRRLVPIVTVWLWACATFDTADSNAATAPLSADSTSTSPTPPMPTSSKDGQITGGHCAANYPAPAKSSWRHTTKSPFATAAGAPQHRIRDVIALPGAAAQLRGRFTYGTIDKDLEDESVELYLQTCPGWQLVATKITDGDGVILFDLPTHLAPGDYRVRMVVRGDLSSADGTFAVWPKGVQVVISDVDGTLTTSDWELFKDVVAHRGATMYANGDEAIRSWATKGYRVIYLTGRPQIYNRYTRHWLNTHNLPAGVVRLTDDARNVVPSEQGVQAFKAAVLKDLVTTFGATIRAGHGNAITDIGAYQAAGIANADLYIIGPHGGKMGSTAVVSYTALLPILAKYPDAAQP